MSCTPLATSVERAAAMMIRVLICDDHMVVREGLKRTLSEVADVTVIDEADNGTDCVRLAQRLRPDVVLLDIALIGRDGLATLADLRRLMPRLPVLMLSTYPERQYAVRCMKLGAAGYLHKSVEALELAEALRTAAAGKPYITPAVAEAMTVSLNLPRERNAVESLRHRTPPLNPKEPPP